MLTNYHSKYYGSEVVVQKDSEVVQVVIRDLLYASADLKTNNAEWTALMKELDEVVKRLETFPSPLFQYQLDLLRDVVVPYLQKLQGRFHTDQARQRQVLDVLYVSTLTSIRHPADALLLLDDLTARIRRSGGITSFYFKSELLTVLEVYLDKKWRPLLMETRALLQNLGGKLLGVGLVGLIGWPLAVLCPLLMSSRQLTAVLKELETKRSLSPSSILLLVKLLAITFVALQLVSVLQTYAYIAHMALALAAACLLISANDNLMKRVMPALAPYADLLESGMSMSPEGLMAVIQGRGSGHSSAPNADTTFTSPRVEELSDEDDKEEVKQKEREREPEVMLDDTGIRKRKAQ